MIPNVYAPTYGELMGLGDSLFTAENYLHAARIYLAAAPAAPGWLTEHLALLASWQASERAQGRMSETEIG